MAILGKSHDCRGDNKCNYSLVIGANFVDDVSSKSFCI